MRLFSTRNDLTSNLRLNEVTPRLKSRIMLLIKTYEVPRHSDNYYSSCLHSWENEGRGFSETPVEKIMFDYGLEFDTDASNARDLNFDYLSRMVELDKDWFTIYDIIERYLTYVSDRKRAEVVNEINRILEEERACYRVVDNLVVPNFSELDAAIIQKVSESYFGGAKQHIKKALELYADRNSPDYNNCIKEAISAVESACCVISNDDKATLGSSLKQLEGNGVYIHPAMRSAFEKLYGYTSDESGIRHGGIDFTEASMADAKFMLITCAAFIDYLEDKYKAVYK